MSLLISVDIKEKKDSLVYVLPTLAPGFLLGKSDWHFLVKLHLRGIPFYPVMAQLKCLMATERNSGLSLCVIVGCL